MLTDIPAGVTVMVVDARAKPSVRQEVAEREASGQCLVCDQPAERRGLCQKCYGQFRTAIREVPKTQRLLAEARLIRQGKILPSRQGQRSDAVNPFREIATGES